MDMMKVFVEEVGDDEEPTYNFGQPEDVLIEVIEDEMRKDRREWPGLYIDGCTVISDDTCGAASYDNAHGMLDYTIMSMCEPPQTAGFYVVTGVTATYQKGDGWTVDDEMTFYHTGLRAATPAEVALY